MLLNLRDSGEWQLGHWRSCGRDGRGERRASSGARGKKRVEAGAPAPYSGSSRAQERMCWQWPLPAGMRHGPTARRAHPADQLVSNHLVQPINHLPHGHACGGGAVREGRSRWRRAGRQRQQAGRREGGTLATEALRKQGSRLLTRQKGKSNPVHPEQGIKGGRRAPPRSPSCLAKGSQKPPSTAFHCASPPAQERRQGGAPRWQSRRGTGQAGEHAHGRMETHQKQGCRSTHGMTVQQRGERGAPDTASSCCSSPEVKP